MTVVTVAQFCKYTKNKDCKWVIYKVYELHHSKDINKKKKKKSL